MTGRAADNFTAASPSYDRRRPRLLASSIAARVRSHWRVKLWMGAALTLVVCLGYFSTSRLPLRTPVRLEPSAVDRAVAFDPRWTAVYFSLYLMLPLAWLAATREQLARYAVGLLLAAGAGYFTFLFFPVIGPRPAGAPVDGLYGLLTRIDSPLGSFPSLHVAFAAYTVCFVAAVLGARRAGPLLLGLAAWTALIAYATLATKQHYFIDVPAGLAVGCAAHWIAWRLPVPARVRPAAAAAAAGEAAA